MIFAGASHAPTADERTIPFPDHSAEAVIVAMTAHHSGPAITLEANGEQVWTTQLPVSSFIERFALAPDLNGDLIREVRVWLRTPARDQRADAWHDVTWILSGATGEALFVIDHHDSADLRFEPWDDGPADVNQDGEVTFEDDLGIILPLRDRPSLAPTFSAWDVFADGALPTNVRRVGAGAGTSRRDANRPNGGLRGSVTVSLRQVDFAGSHTVHRDYTTPSPVPGDGVWPLAPIPPVYPAQWYDANGDGVADNWDIGDIRGPIMYTAGDDVIISTVIIDVDPPGSITLTSARVIGAVNGADTFICLTPTYNGAQDQITATTFIGHESSTPGVIRFWEDWTIEWRIEDVSVDPATVYQAGQSSNHLYFVLLDPTGNFQIRYSLLDIGCRRADGLGGGNLIAVADAIFGEFTNAGGTGPAAAVHRRTDVLEGLPTPSLTYYADWQCIYTSHEQLLQYVDGQCAAWASFFLRCLHTVGVDPQHEWVGVHYVDADWLILGAEFDFFVKNWRALGPQRNPHPSNVDYPRLNVVDYPFITNNTYQWQVEDVRDGTGVPGQGVVPDPASLFQQHFIIDVDDHFYDPSYGRSYTHFADFETASVDFYGIFFHPANAPLWLNEMDFNVDFDGNGIVENIWVSVHAWVLKSNPPGNQLSRELADIPR